MLKNIIQMTNYYMIINGILLIVTTIFDVTNIFSPIFSYSFENIIALLGISFFFGLIFKLILSILDDIAKRQFRNLFWKLSLSLLFVLMTLAGFRSLQYSILRARITLGTSQLVVEMNENGLNYNAIPDSLLNDVTIKVVKQNFDVAVFYNDSGNRAWYFKPLEDSKLTYGMCIDDSGRVRSYIPDLISLFDECIQKNE